MTGADAGVPHAPLPVPLSTAARSPYSSIAAQVVAAGAASSERGLERLVEPGLSARQQEILDLLLMGKKNQEVGDILGISPRTVEVHVTSLLRKTGARSRVELVAHVLRRAGESRTR
ncbi:MULTISPECIES: helix-turn-helix domain-containing protein [Bacteria]|uniref:helix-turn-helix domain-containing protein n=1 Tax=Bacteria TaxID=2 RepID=UPI003C79C733